MLEDLFDYVTEALGRRGWEHWRRRRISRTIAALSRGEAVRIRCEARFRGSGGRRLGAHLMVTSEGVFVSTADGTVSNLCLGTADSRVEIITEQLMMVCDVAGRQLEVLLPAGEESLLSAVVARLPDSDNEQHRAGGIPPGPTQG